MTAGRKAGGADGGWGTGTGRRASQEEGRGSSGGKAEPVIRGGVRGHWRRNAPERAFARERG